MTTIDAVHIEDLAAPQFTPDVREVLDLMASMADQCPLEVDGLQRRAAAETGLDDFGEPDYEERLAVLCDAYRDVRGLQPYGVVSLHSQLLQCLKNRLVLTDLLRRHPEIHDIALEPPIIIAGLPRTGTTHLHNLMAADPAFRTLPYWESVEPYPLPSERGVEPDPRRARCDVAVEFMGKAMPLFERMHEMTTDHVHEEIQLLAVDFSTMLFETIGHVPAWADYYRSHDQTPHYRYLRTMLQALQYERGTGRWLLKSPQHLEQLPVLAEVFPDATVVVTHRDPVSVTVSMTTMLTYTARTHADPVDVTGIARDWADRLQAMLDGCVRDRDVLGPERSMDVRFDEFMADDVATAQRVYELADQPWTDASETALRGYLDAHRRGRHGTIDYDATPLGLDPADLAEKFGPYVRRFLT